jgi:hypothetical protein
VTEGESVRGVYPIGPERMADYENWKEEQNR